MKVNKLNNPKINIKEKVSENLKLKLGNGKSVYSIEGLYGALHNLDQDTFYHHLNEFNNDFYKWVKEVYKDKKLANDLFECTTKEAVMFCLKSRLEGEDYMSILNGLPKENIMENINDAKLILNQLPRKNVMEPIPNINIHKPLVTLLDHSIFNKKTVEKPLVTMLNPSLFKQTKLKKAKIKKKPINNSSKRPNAQNEKFNKSQIKKIKSETPSEMLDRIKEVYKID